MERPEFIVAGNWKMNMSLTEAQSFIQGISVPKSTPELGVWLAVPSPYLYPLSQLDDFPQSLHIGAQHCHGAEHGAFTGECSHQMLRDTGASFTLIGHSERRQYFGETIESAAERCLKLLDKEFPVIFCIGEMLEDREAGNTGSVLREQLEPLLNSLTPSQASSLILAYEPVWAIGTGKVASLEQIEETHAMIKVLLAEHGFKAPILYGGSVKPENFADIAALDSVDGGLIGGASLSVDSFQSLVSIGMDQVS